MSVIGDQLFGAAKVVVPHFSTANAGYNLAKDIGGALQDKLSVPAAKPAPVQHTYQYGAGSAGEEADIGGQLAYYDDQANQLRSLLGRTETAKQQGMTRLNDDYAREVGFQDSAKEKALTGFNDSEVGVKKNQASTYDTINRNANNGFRSLAQIIGRSAGTGSSAFQELLPNVIGKDTSGKRIAATETATGNLNKIKTARESSMNDFSRIYADLQAQRKSGEGDLLSGIEEQRQSINGQLSTAAAQRAQAAGGGYAQVKAAQAPFQQAVEGSRNAVENFFNDFRTPYTRQNAQVQAPQLGTYTPDQSVINAQAGGASDGSNPYSEILKKKLQEQV